VVVEGCKLSFEPYDRSEMSRFETWDAVQELLLIPSNREIALVKPALSHLATFVTFFKTKLGPILDPAALWGALGILIQVSSESSRAARTIHRVLKSIGYKADSFNSCVATLPVIPSQIKEACFDIQVQLLEFFVEAVKCIRGEEDDGRYGRSASNPSNTDET
jgi:hypothetical protein